MSRHRVLILSPDALPYSASAKDSSLTDVAFSFASDWKAGEEILDKESFSAVVIATKSFGSEVGETIRRLMNMAPRTPVVVVLPGSDCKTLRAVLQKGAEEVLFEDEIDRLFAPALCRCLFTGQGLARKASLSELFDWCYPVATTTDLDLLATTIVETLVDSFGAAFGILFRDRDPSAEIAGGYSILFSSGFEGEGEAGKFLRSCGPLFTDKGVGGAPIVIPAEGAGGSAAFFLSLGFDLGTGNKMFLVLGLRDEPGEAIVKGGRLDFFCQQARFALLNAERHREAQHLIYVDDLTKCYNSRYLNVVLDRELKRSERYRNFFSLLFMDLDYFKKVNDQHGHLVGTRVLVETGLVLKACVRESDTVVRYGGDEFVVILVETNSEEAMHVAERMRRMIEQKTFAYEMGCNIHLTISIGVAAFPEHAATKQQLINMADEAMYHGKESTRNVVYLSPAQKPT